jgi:isopenicillin N synthase-like dioxygenase
MDAKDFEKEEPFPEGLKIAELETLSLAKILDAENAETKRLFEACKAYGFFYLNLQDSDTGIELLDSAASMFRFSEGLFNLPEDEKAKYDLKGRGSFYG